jgi:ribosomal protein S30
VLTKAGDVRVEQGATLNAPALTKAGNVRVYQGATLNAPSFEE